MGNTSGGCGFGFGSAFGCCFGIVAILLLSFGGCTALLTHSVPTNTPVPPAVISPTVDAPLAATAQPPKNSRLTKTLPQTPKQQGTYVGDPNMSYYDAMHGGCGDLDPHSIMDALVALTCQLNAAKTPDEIEDCKTKWTEYESSFKTETNRLENNTSDFPQKAKLVYQWKVMQQVQSYMRMAADYKSRKQYDQMRKCVHYAAQAIAHMPPNMRLQPS